MRLESIDGRGTAHLELVQGALRCAINCETAKPAGD
jgi:hypothetical protein